MYAEIIDTGQRIEVVGFVHHSRITWAVWRDDHGLLFEVPSYAIRMLPNTGTLPYVEGSLEVSVQ